LLITESADVNAMIVNTLIPIDLGENQPVKPPTSFAITTARQVKN
tara:strand:+ start:284 stop:418 length:135 start_codon:yes stop_codon:yes gene_type:complete